MKVLTYPLGELQANCYFLVQDKDCVIIDPGDSADFILEEVSRNNLQVKAIIATHGHFDHVMAIGELKMSLNVPVYISSKDRFLLDRVEETAKYFLGHMPVVIPISDTVNIPEILRIKSLELKIIHSPGHTPGSVCIYDKEEGILFTGDTIFKDGIGRYDFSYSNKKELLDSISRLIEVFPEETLVYPGHGDPTTLGDERRSLAQLL
ncbi:MAG: MBL fold metallo-hydrolase [Rhodocyclaceae bacterium]|nr:MBL fold metallo-hydrolase [Rhodocyclaceae bacterium]